ncbi:MULTISPECIES: hypothetical protein [unclassified Bradyrhizobium]|uniref:hypothetical protein n=1 Tax=unclassified Bradyrhizobium TaxID=2631580 RepID=UPI002916566E|nr:MULTISPECIES: hypothetical protein [unclassified Bradyrhizobium]
MNMFGAIMQSAIAQATQAEWRKLPPTTLTCVDETLRQRGISVQVLANNGVSPSDTRLYDVLTTCRSQSDLRQANTRWQPAPEPGRVNPDPTQSTPSAGLPSKYRVDKIPLGSTISYDTAFYKEYQCRPSDQFSGFTWCQKQRTERASRGEYLSSYSMLHTENGRVYYLNRSLDPAFFDPGEVSSDIERLSRTYGEQPRILPRPQHTVGVSGVIAYWGNVILEPLDATAIATVASGRSPGGMLVDFAGNYQESIRQDLPIYRVAGGPGFVWAESHDANGRGRLRFFAIDASTLSAPSTKTPQANTDPSPTPDPWKDCQSSDTETRLAGCTRVIDAKGPDRVRLADAFDGRCSAYNQKQAFQPALSDCKTAIDLNPKYSYAYANLGAAYLGLNDSVGALSALNKAIALKTNFIWSRLSRAKALEASGANTEDALRDYQYALLIDPTNQVAKDGVVKLMADPTSSKEDAESCFGAPNERPVYIAASAAASSATTLEMAISAISSSTQTYRAKLDAQLLKIDRLTRDVEAADRQQSVLTGPPDERRKIVNDVQRLSDSVSESQARLNALSGKISEREGELKTGPSKARQKEITRELAKLRSTLAAAEQELNQKTSERDDASVRAQQRGADIAKALVRLEAIRATKDGAESCARQIKAGIDVLDQKADEIRQKQREETAKALQVNAESLLSDLSEFAKKNASLVPLEVGPLVAALKGALSTRDPVKTSDAFSTMQRRLDEIPEFKPFRASRDEAREEAARAELDQLSDTTRTMADFVESYAKRNITSDNAQDLIKLKGRLSEALVRPETDALKQTISDSEQELGRLHLEQEYRDYRTKHPIQSRSSIPAATGRNRLLVEGPLDETLILVNESGQAGVVRNMRGDLVFDRGSATLCFLHENNLDAFGMSELKGKVVEKGARTVGVSASPCEADSLGRYDLVAVNRGLFATLPAKVASAVLKAVDRGAFALLGSVSERELQNARNADSIKSLQLENDLQRKAIDGFGLVSIANGTSVVCQTVADREKAHESLIERASDRLQVELGSSPKVISTSIESAFVSAKRGQCGAIYGASKDLRELIAGLQRDKLNYHVLPIWLTPADVEAEAKNVAEAEARSLREKRQLEQKKKDDQYREELHSRQSDAEKRDRQERLQKESGALARGLQELITDHVKEFAAQSSERDDKTYVRQWWPALATWYRERIAGKWELEDVASELRDYGTVKWKNRILEAGFVALTFKMKNRGLGEHEQKCFTVGYVADREFEVARDPIAVPCEDEGAVSRYKLALEFSSKWLAN